MNAGRQALIDTLEASIDRRCQEIEDRIRRVKQAKEKARRLGRVAPSVNDLTEALGDTAGASPIELKRATRMPYTARRKGGG